MRGRYYRDFDLQQMAEHFRAETAEGAFLPAVPAYNVAPTTTQPVIREARDTGAREIVPMRWGLVGSYTAGPDPKRATFNARAETIGESPLWRTPFHRRHCLVPLAGFYEWRKPDKTPFRFFLPAEPAFALAGIWDAWPNPVDGSWLQSFAIVTTEANKLMASIHDRMPVILRPEDYNRRLSRGDPAQPPSDLLRPFDADRMAMTPGPPQGWQCPQPGADMLNSA